MVENIEKLYSTQFLWDEPVEYKGITLFPVTCKDIQDFYSCVNCILYDPLRYNSVISTLPRLYFLTDILNHQDDAEYIMQNEFLFAMFICFQKLLKLVLGESQDFNFAENKGKWYLQIIKHIDGADDISIDIRAKDFDELRAIILHQNGVEYDDTFIHADIRKWLEEQESRDNTQYSTIEDYLNAFISVAHWKPQEVKELSLRRFNGIIDKFLSHDTYNLQMTASMSGLVSFKGKINHWLTTNKKNQIYEKYFKEVK